MLRHLAGDLIRDFTFVKGIRPLAGNQLQTMREILLHQPIALLPRRAVRFVEDRFAVGMGNQHLFAVGLQVIRQRIVDWNTVTRQSDSRCQQSAQRQSAIFLRSQRQSSDGARRAGGEMRSQRQLTVGVALLIQEHVARRMARRHFTEIDSSSATRGGAQQHKAASAQVARLRMGHGQRKAHGDRGIHRIPALTQNFHAHLGCQRIHRRHHAVVRFYRVKSITVHTVGDRRSLSGRGVRACHHGKTHHQRPAKLTHCLLHFHPATIPCCYLHFFIISASVYKYSKITGVKSNQEYI